MILNLDEINSAIDLIGGIYKSKDGYEVKLNQPRMKKSDYIVEEDVVNAMKIYNEHLKK